MVVVITAGRFKCAPRAHTLTRTTECVGRQIAANDAPGEYPMCRACVLGRRVAESVGVTFGEVSCG